jgi:hypothetical protein
MAAVTPARWAAAVSALANEVGFLEGAVLAVSEHGSPPSERLLSVLEERAVYLKRELARLGYGPDGGRRT